MPLHSGRQLLVQVMQCVWLEFMQHFYVLLHTWPSKSTLTENRWFINLSQRWLWAWASEEFFSGGGALGDFPKIFSRWGPEVVKFGFYPSKLKNNPFFANNFKIQGAGKATPCPPLPTPMIVRICLPYRQGQALSKILKMVYFIRNQL